VSEWFVMTDQLGAERDRDRQHLGVARQRLTVALTRSTAAPSPATPAGRSAATRIATAAASCRQANRADLAARLERARDGDVTTPACRATLREVQSKLDAALADGVRAAPFRAASDGGER